MSTEPMSMDQAIEALVQPEEQPTEEVVEETESLSDEEVTDEAEEEQPIEDSDDDAEEVEESDDEPESDDADDEGDEDYEDDVDDEEDDQEPEQLITVKVDGVEEQVTLEDLKRGYSGQKYVQQGMQKAAEAKKEAEQVYASLLQERQNLAQLVNNLQQGALTPPVEPSPDLADSDPIGYVEATAKYNRDLKAYQESMGKVQEQMSAQSAAERQARLAYAAQEAEVMREMIPELRDPQKAEAFTKKISETAQHYGYTPEEMQNITSHRDLLVLRDAMRYRELQSKGDIVREKSKKARKPIKAGTKKIPSKDRAIRNKRDKLRQSGSIDDALALILNPDLK